MATYHGITQATCLNCGEVTKDESTLEMLNDLDPQCLKCQIHLVAWFCSDGSIVVTGETDKGDEIRSLIIKEKTK